MNNPTISDMQQYLWAGGWMQNMQGWWHPPNCLASWPIEEAYEMAMRDESAGLRITRDELDPEGFFK